jgi:carboxypeptidase C (cathepsin A)
MTRRMLPAALLVALGTAAFAGGMSQRVAAQAGPGPTPAPSYAPIPRVRDAVTRHTIVLGGKRIAYTARAGRLLLHDANGEPTASVFYVAYTADHSDAKRRPVTFLWNGGPGSSTIWLHMGSFGPERVAVPKDGTQPPPTARLVTNESSLLDTSDLVFVDAVGTGWSRIVAHAKPSDFFGVDEDAHAFAQFIERWATVNSRWESPKFLFGESYGTTRAANVANVLQNDGMAVNGVVLLSSALDYNFLPIGQGPGNDYVYIGYLPTEAAVAWYHHKVAGNPRDLERFVAEVRAFAGGPYAQALMLGDALDARTRAQIVARLHAYTGLSTDYIERADLRISPNRFREELLRSEGQSVGRYDGRYAGHEIDPNGTNPTDDFSDTMTSAAYVAAFYHYAHDVLHYAEDRPYEVLSFHVNRSWKYQRTEEDGNAVTVVGDLRSAIVQNPYLHVLSANGYFDLATGFYGTEYLLHHMNLTPAESRRVTFAYFASGHEVYLNHDALIQFKADLVRFYHDAIPR